MLPFEVIVRAILTGSAAAAHEKGEPYCGYTFPKEMKEGDRFEVPIVTLTTKEEDGHDKPITIEEAYSRLAEYYLDNDVEIDLDEFDDLAEVADTFELTEGASIFIANQLFKKRIAELEGDEEAAELDDDTLDVLIGVIEDVYGGYQDDEEAWEIVALLALYNEAVVTLEEVCELAMQAFAVINGEYDHKGFVLVDTKFEFGLDEFDDIILADEVGTMDSSRIIDKEIFLATGKMVNHDKQPVRDDLKAKGFTGDEGQEFPGFSEGILEQTSRNYVTTCIELTSPEFAKEFLPEEAFAL